MKSSPTASLILACLTSLASAAATPPACTASSGGQRAVLLELYTSEGCDSCPPADRRLSQFVARTEYAGRVVPLAFHVDYWDRLGWTDRFASPRYTQRQYAQAERAGSHRVYTPQFLRNGRDWRGAGDPLDARAEPRAETRIALELSAPRGARLTIGGEIAAQDTTAEAYLALYENNLASQVRAGENAGKTLRHDYVVRRLIGPLALGPDGRLSLRRELALEADWKPADLGIAAFVQDKATGEVLQALQRHACGI